MSEIKVPEWDHRWGRNAPVFSDPARRKAYLDHLKLGLFKRECDRIAQISKDARERTERAGRAAFAKQQRGELLEGSEPFYLAIHLLIMEAQATRTASLVADVRRASKGATEEVVVGRNADGTVRTRVRPVRGDFRAAKFLLEAGERGTWCDKPSGPQAQAEHDDTPGEGEGFGHPIPSLTDMSMDDLHLLIDKLSEEGSDEEIVRVE